MRRFSLKNEMVPLSLFSEYYKIMHFSIKNNHYSKSLLKNKITFSLKKNFIKKRIC